MSKMKAVQLDDQERLLIIDQTRLPAELVFIELDDKGSLVDAIARLKVRGAPAIGIAAAYLTAEATAQGLSTCIIGWLDDAKLRAACGLNQPVRLVIALGYAKEGDPLREKKRRDMGELADYR